MKVSITSKQQNNLMKRKEVSFSVDHSETGGTPTRAEVSNQLASLLKVKRELVYITNMQTKTGTMTTVGDANVYDSVEQAKNLEPKHIVNRNAVPEKTVQEEAPEENTEEE
ncbi:MAG: 30S ribosomal protein S24e [Candidatus Bathyarchaeota archaeon]|nr:30S ribosomal protein S24e [Candidatus Bathyarchaeum tardum]WGM88782.1 MAG: 30S ribosomal protein S24e [Candidatus Bathyarchaeum tardum]WNZ28965.1 MAG: 30S ribosomal protein S24e [Candidatus Bathyarchaeota archaeon]